MVWKTLGLVAVLALLVFVTRKRRQDRSAPVVVPVSDGGAMAEDDIEAVDPANAPGWALLLRSPFAAEPEGDSWFGGAPVAPPGFDWPLDGAGTPMIFLMQIDLSALDPEPETGALPPGLPREGAMLLFIAQRTYRCIVLEPDAMAGAAPVALPEKAREIRDLGFFGEKGQRAFPRWALDPVPFLNGAADGEEEARPDAWPDRFTDPVDWIDTWGVAALEAETVIEEMERELRFGREFAERDAQGAIEAPNDRVQKVLDSKRRFHALLNGEGVEVLEALRAWRSRAAAEAPQGAVDRGALVALFGSREALAAKMESYGLKYSLPGRAGAVWDALDRRYPEMRTGDFSGISEGYRGFVAAWVTDWRGHRLFGGYPTLTDFHDAEGTDDCLVQVAGDGILDTDTEHCSGFALCCPTRDMRAGRHGNGATVFFTNV